MPDDSVREGVTRSASGRTTYAPDGLQNNVSLPADNVHISNPGDGTPNHPRNRGSFESNTPVDRRSMDEKDPEKDESASHSHQFPPPQRASADESDGADDIERQKTREQDRHAGGQEEKDPHLIEWDGPDDPDNPMNWPTWWKWTVTTSLGLMTFCITFASSVFSTATMVTAEKFGVSTEVMTLGTSLFVLVSTILKSSRMSRTNTIIGFCSRPDHIRTTLRIVRSEIPALLRLLCVRNLPDSSCCCSEPLHHYALSLFRRIVWFR